MRVKWKHTTPWMVITQMRESWNVGRWDLHTSPWLPQLGCGQNCTPSFSALSLHCTTRNSCQMICTLIHTDRISASIKSIPRIHQKQYWPYRSAWNMPFGATVCHLAITCPISCVLHLHCACLQKFSLKQIVHLRCVSYELHEVWALHLTTHFCVRHLTTSTS